jgi:hypothetical protein
MTFPTNRFTRTYEGNNTLELNQGEWLINGVAVTATAEQLNSDGSGSVISVDTGAGLTGGPITISGTVSLANVGSEDLLANLTGASAVPLPHTLSAIMDYSFDNVQGGILFRSASAWQFLAASSIPGYYLQSGGPGEDPAWNSASTWVDQTTTSVTMANNTGYTADAGASLITFTLPAVSFVGNYLEIDGKGSGLWTIAQGAGQQIHVGDVSSTSGVTGSVSSILQYDSIKLRCITGNLEWIVVSCQGNFTIV